MIIWIDGPYGVGKTTIIAELQKQFTDNDAEFLLSDYFYRQSLKQLIEESKASKSFPHFGGTMPQNNMRFLQDFRNLIEYKEKNTKKKLIIDMALTMKECKENLFDSLKNEGINIIHIIFSAEEETIKSRIINDETREQKTAFLDNLAKNIIFLNENFTDAIKVSADNRTVSNITNEVIGIIQSI